MAIKHFRVLPGVRIPVHVRTARKSCEHLSFLGAFADFSGALAHYEAPMIVLAGKAAFVVGMVGVYLMHAEEAHPGI